MCYSIWNVFFILDTKYLQKNVYWWDLQVSPKAFYQCFIIITFDDQTDAYVPIFYILLTSKIQQIYTQALCCLEFSVNWNLEPNIQNAIYDVFPQVNVNRYLFHWKQVYWRKSISLQLQEKNVSDTDVETSSLSSNNYFSKQICIEGNPLCTCDCSRWIRAWRFGKNGEVLVIFC